MGREEHEDFALRHSQDGETPGAEGLEGGFNGGIWIDEFLFTIFDPFDFAQDRFYVEGDSVFCG